MKPELAKALEAAGAPPPDFWESELEMGLEHVFAHFREEGRMEAWVEKRKGRQVNALLKTCGETPGTSARKNKETLLSCNGQLLQYGLVDWFGKRKSRQAVVDIALDVLSESELDDYRVGDAYDDRTMLYGLYRRDPQLLHKVLLVDKMHKSGFARMVLDKNLRRPEQPLEEYLSEQSVAALLRECDLARNDDRTSELKGIERENDHCTLFIRRADRPEMIVGPSGVQHGYKPEWIILDFSASGKRVGISSMSMTAPVQIANRIAQEYFAKPCTYLNESQITATKQLEHFFTLLRDNAVEHLTLVELTLKSSPLAEQVELRLGGPEGIGNAIAGFERLVGPLLSDIGQIESFRLAHGSKRVHLKIEKAENVDNGFVVRYSDGKLNRKQRKQFEEHMEREHGIIVLSTEKR